MKVYNVRKYYTEQKVDNQIYDQLRKYQSKTNIIINHK
jgi:hypothetical protein